MREVTNSGNIGSIITMLIDEQHVNIEDILTEEQFRQDCQHQAETKIKEEVEPALTDFGTNNYQDFPFSAGQNYRPAENNVWSSGGLQSDLQTGLEKGGELVERENESFHSSVQNLLTSVPSVTTQSRPLPCLSASSPTNSVRDDKYWERRRSDSHFTFSYTYNSIERILKVLLIISI